MELLASVVVGVLFAVGTYLLLAKNILRVVLGSGILAYGTNIMLLTSGRLKRGIAPVLTGENLLYADPLPQALILTAIVINFAVTAFMFVLAYRAVQEHGTDNLAEMRGLEHD
jgi:multicomponent Na+:H+ antiporter subunit C